MRKIYVKESRIHYRGVYASQVIHKGECIVEYTGRRLTNAQVERSHSDFLFGLNQRVTVDGKNIARYINHSCNPNCEAEIDRGHIWIHAIKKIKRGQELTYNYGYTLKDDELLECNCKAHNCLGHILDQKQWKRYRKLLRRQRVLEKKKVNATKKRKK